MKVTIDVQLIAETKNSTLSVIRIGSEHLGFAVEDGFRAVKEAGETRISGGNFEIKKRFHGRFYEKYKLRYGYDYALEICNVPNFTNILIHIGNYVRNTRGCLLINTGCGFTSSDYFGNQSARAYQKLWKRIDKEFNKGNQVFINIIR